MPLQVTQVANKLAGSGLKALGGGAFGTAASATSTGLGKGILGALGLSNPIGWVGLGLHIGLSLLWRKIFKPKIEPLPVRSINITGGREVARYVLGRRRIDLEWTDATTLPGGQYRDNYKQFIACMSEGPCESIAKVWVDQDPFETIQGENADHLIPPAGSAYRLPPGDVTQYGFPTPYAFEIRQKLLADGNQAGTAHTDSFPIPSRRQYNGNPGGDNWGSKPTERTTLYRDPVAVCADGYTLDDSDPENPVCRNDLDMSDTDTPTFDPDRAAKINYALEVKAIDEHYRLEGISWAQVNWFEPFYQQSDRGSKLYQKPPDVAVLLEGLKIKTGKDYATATAEYSDNPVAILRWLDIEYRGESADRIDADAYAEAYAKCEETITYRYGSAAPDDAVGSAGDYYARSNQHIYRRDATKWNDLGEFQGDYDWLAAQGSAGVYAMKRYRFSGELEIGSDIEDMYEKVLACCGDGRRYEHRGKIYYRVGQPRASTLNLPQADIWEVGGSPAMDVSGRACQQADCTAGTIRAE